MADCNFCTATFLTGLAQREAFFVIRGASGRFPVAANGATVSGHSETGEISEQPIGFIDQAGQEHHWRKRKQSVKKKKTKPTCDKHKSHVATAKILKA